MAWKPAHWIISMLIMFLAFPALLLADKSIVRLDTNYGQMTIELENDQAPNTVENFLTYVNDGFYEGLIFHRIDQQTNPPFNIIQAGAWDADLYDLDFTAPDPNIYDPTWYHQPGDPIALEVQARLQNLRGTIAMARTSDINSATSQFFINNEDNASLNPTSDSNGYAVFGRVTQGLEIMDDIAQMPVENAYSSFQDLPVDPVIIENASVIREFDPDSADLTDFPFLHAQDGVIRTFLGQANLEFLNVRHEFQQIEYLGIQCLQWKQVSDSVDDLDNFTILMATDTAGQGWILKYILNEGTDLEQIIVHQVDALVDAVTFEEMAQTRMIFRLITGQYNPDNLDDPENQIDAAPPLTPAQEITALNETVPAIPVYPDNLILVKTTTDTQTAWSYYHQDIGLVLQLANEQGLTDGDGWKLVANFGADSDDFSDVPFLNIPNDLGDEFTRTYIGQGEYEDQYYTHTFTWPDETISDVHYIQWQQTPYEDALLDQFTLNLAKDAEGTIWVFTYILNGQTILDVSDLLDAVPLSTYNNIAHLRLIAGGYNPDDLNDPQNTYTHDLDGQTQTQQIISLDADVEHIPFYQNELIQIDTFLGANPQPEEIDSTWFHESIGPLLLLEDGAEGPDATGWHLAFFGGRFDNETSTDFSETPFLHATQNQPRTFIGQGRLQDQSYTHTFSRLYASGIYCLRWKQTTDFPDAIDTFDIYLAKDQLDNIWVFRYYVNNVRIFYAGSGDDAEGKLLSEFADDNFLFRLVAGAYNPDNIDDPINTITYQNDDNQTITEQLTNLQAYLDLPGYPDGFILTKITNDQTPDQIGWSYFHPSVGTVLSLQGTSDTPADPNYFNPDDLIPIYDGLDAWRLGYYGQPQPEFNAQSSDFSQTPFLDAKYDDLRLYRGIGHNFVNYWVFFDRESFLDTRCLRMSQTERAGELDNGVSFDDDTSSNPSVPAHSFLMANDTTGTPWLFQAVWDDEIIFQADTIDQIVPFSLYPDMRLRLMTGDFDQNTAVQSGTGDDLFTEQIVRTEDSVDDLLPDYSEELVFVKQGLGQAPTAEDRTWYHESIGPVLTLWNQPVDPNQIDTEKDGWLIADPNQINDLLIKIKASRDRTSPRDSFTLTGTIDSDDINLQDALYFVKVGPYDVQIGPLRSNPSEKKFSYRGTIGAQSHVFVKIDAQTKEFRMTANNIDLTGIEEPIQVHLIYRGTSIPYGGYDSDSVVDTDSLPLWGHFFASGTAQLPPNQQIPIQLIRGQKDLIRTIAYRFITDDYLANNSLRVTGDIAFINDPNGLSDKDITLSWAGTNYAIAADPPQLKKHPRREIYNYNSASGTLRSANFNLENNSFRVFLKKTGLSAPNAARTLGIKIEDQDGNILFDQKTTVP